MDTLKQSMQLQREFGQNVTFQIYKDSRQIHSIIIPGKSIRGKDTTSDVCAMLRSMIASAGTKLKPSDALLLTIDGSAMDPKSLFYADHYLMLPCWITVHVKESS